MRNENGQKVEKYESTEEKNKNFMETTDTDNSDVENVNINKSGSKKTSRWNRPKIDLSLKDLEYMSITHFIQITVSFPAVAMNDTARLYPFFN